jgi:hypothetical protein
MLTVIIIIIRCATVLVRTLTASHRRFRNLIKTNQPVAKATTYTNTETQLQTFMPWDGFKPRPQWPSNHLRPLGEAILPVIYKQHGTWMTTNTRELWWLVWGKLTLTMNAEKQYRSVSHRLNSKVVSIGRVWSLWAQRLSLQCPWKWSVVSLEVSVPERYL